MSKSNKTAIALGAAVAAMTLTGAAFAMQSLSQGYTVAAAHVDAEGKCGEGKCGGSA